MSAFTDNDKFDLKIGGHTIDVKTSMHPDFVGQVSPGCMNKNGISVFCFLLTDSNLSFVEPIGWASYKKFVECAHFVAHNDLIRNTGIRNKFVDGSWFVERECLEDFFTGLRWFVSSTH